MAIGNGADIIKCVSYKLITYLVANLALVWQFFSVDHILNVVCKALEHLKIVTHDEMLLNK